MPLVGIAVGDEIELSRRRVDRPFEGVGHFLVHGCIKSLASRASSEFAYHCAAYDDHCVDPLQTQASALEAFGVNVVFCRL